MGSDPNCSHAAIAEEGTAIAKVGRNAPVSEANYCNRSNKYRWLAPSEMKTLRQREEENGKLKTLLVEGRRQSM